MNEFTAELIDRASAYGDGVFESIAIRDGKPRFWDAHMERMQTGCERLGLVSPPPAEILRLLECELAESKELTAFATARLSISAAASPRGYQRNAGGATVPRISVFASKPVSKNRLEEGVVTRLCNLRLAIQPALAGMKSLNRLEQVLARAEWDDTDTFEGLTMDSGGRLICGTMSNVFIVNEAKLSTPGITRCGVAGIMRARVLRRLEETGISCSVRDILPGELHSATEVFLTNSQFGVLPVKQIDEMSFAVGDVTRQAQELMAADGVPECQP